MSVPETPSPRRVRFLFIRLRFALVLVPILGVVLAWVILPYLRQHEAVKTIDRKFGSVVYDQEVISPDGETTPEAARRNREARDRKTGRSTLPPLPLPATRRDRIVKWMREKVGNDLLHDVVEVNAYGSDITDNDLSLIAELPKLETLHLSRSQVSDAGLARLKRMKQLKHLFLNDTKVTDAGLAYLVDLDQLEELTVNRNPGITDAGIVHIKGLKKLRILEFGGTKVTDAGLEELKEIASLWLIFAGDTLITDAGLEELKELKNLRHLWLHGSKVTVKGIEKLQKVSPKIAIHQ